MPSVYRQKNNIVPAIRGCAKSAAPDVLYAARIDVYKIFVELGRLIFGDMNSAVALFHCGQILFMAACFAYAAMTLYDSGVPVWVWVVVTVLYAVLPYNIYYSVTMWKDVPFAGAVLLFVTALYRLLQEVGRHNLWTLCVGGLGVCLWRTNGWYAFLVTFLVMVICLKKNYKNITCAMVGVLIVSWVLLNPFLWYLGADEIKLTETLSVPFQQIARVVANDRVLTEEEQKWLSEFFYLGQHRINAKNRIIQWVPNKNCE